MNHSVRIEYKEQHSTAGYSWRSNRMFYEIKQARANIYERVGELNTKKGSFKIYLNDKLAYDSSDKRFHPETDLNNRSKS